MSKVQFFKYPAAFSNWDAFHLRMLNFVAKTKSAGTNDITTIEKDYLFSTMLSLGFDRPFYRIWPDVISMFQNMKPSLTRDIILPEPALTIEIPSSANLKFSSIFVAIKNIDSFTQVWQREIKKNFNQDSPSQFVEFIKNKFRSEEFRQELILHQKQKVKDFLISLYYPEKHQVPELGKEYSGNKYCRVFHMDTENEFVPYEEENFVMHDGKKSNISESTKENLHNDLKIAFQIITGVSIIAGDPDPDVDMLEPVILSKDQHKLKSDKSNIIELSQRAIRKTKTKGFEIGKGFHQKSQNNPTYAVGAHFQHYWIGKKNSPNRQKIYKLRRGYIAGTKNLKKVPTGYYSEKSE